MIRKIQNYVNGRWNVSQGEEVRDIINPATDEIIAQVCFSTKEETEGAIDVAQEAWMEIERAIENIEVASGVTSLMDDTLLVHVLCFGYW